MVETSSVIGDPMDSAGVSRSRLTRLGCWVAGLAGVLLLFYGVVGYFGCANMFGDHPRWRGMNRGPADFGLRGETVSFTSQDGIPLKAWWLPPMVGHEEPLSSPTGSITRDKSCCRVQLFSSMPVMTFSPLTSEVTGKQRDRRLARTPGSAGYFGRSSIHPFSRRQRSRGGLGSFLRGSRLPDRRCSVFRDRWGN